LDNFTNKRGKEILEHLQILDSPDRYGQIQDPYGHRWAIATHKKDVSPEEMEKAAKEFFT